MNATCLIFCFCLLLLSACRNEQASSADSPEETVSEGLMAMQERLKNDNDHSLKIRNMQKAIRLFHSEIGRLPMSIDELKRLEYIDTIPVAPEGLIYHYDPNRGNFQLMTHQTYKMLMNIQTEESF